MEGRGNTTSYVKLKWEKEWQLVKRPLQRDGTWQNRQHGWLKILNEIYDMEQLTHRIRVKEERCHEKWEKLIMCTCQRQDRPCNGKAIKIKY